MKKEQSSIMYVDYAPAVVGSISSLLLFPDGTPSGRGPRKPMVKADGKGLRSLEFLSWRSRNESDEEP